MELTYGELSWVKTKASINTPSAFRREAKCFKKTLTEQVERPKTINEADPNKQPETNIEDYGYNPQYPKIDRCRNQTRNVDRKAEGGARSAETIRSRYDH